MINWNIFFYLHSNICRSSYPELFLEKVVPKICSKFTGEHPCRSMISINLHWNFTETALRHGCSSVNLLHIFRTPFFKNTSGRLLLIYESIGSCSIEKSFLPRSFEIMHEGFLCIEQRNWKDGKNLPYNINVLRINIA